MSFLIDHRPGRQAEPPRSKRDPAPSRLKYRLERMWLTPLYRRVVRVGLPAFLVAMTAGIWMADEGRRTMLTGGITGLVEKIQSREAFQVKMMTIEGASPAVDKALRGMLPIDLPASSFDLDLVNLRLQVLQLDAVKDIELRVKPGGVLSAVVTERVPAMLWRNARGIDMLDAKGHRVAGVTSREVRPDLPLIAGVGADQAAEEAMALIDAAGPILPRVRGLVRRGERRWDLVLDEGQEIKLPTEGAVTALGAAIAMHRAQDLLGRDIRVVDLRNPSRPVLQLGLDAQNTIRTARGMVLLGPDGKPMEEKEGG